MEAIITEHCDRSGHPNALILVIKPFYYIISIYLGNKYNEKYRGQAYTFDKIALVWSLPVADAKNIELSGVTQASRRVGVKAKKAEKLGKMLKRIEKNFFLSNV